MNIAIFGAGCFWCVEAIFSQLAGVDSVISGYSNGTTKNPTYESVCSGKTGYAEVCKISYDPNIISFEELLTIFFQTHNPTTLNRQGADKGTQYRSGIYYTSEEQKKIAEEYIKKLTAENAFNDPIVTEIIKLNNFHEAEDYHQDYYKNNENAPYCRIVIKPKLDKFFK
jgi:peptide-methionine (S)-S-oxide reductase